MCYLSIKMVPKILNLWFLWPRPTLFAYMQTTKMTRAKQCKYSFNIMLLEMSTLCPTMHLLEVIALRSCRWPGVPLRRLRPHSLIVCPTSNGSAAQVDLSKIRSIACSNGARMPLPWIACSLIDLSKPPLLPPPPDRISIGRTTEVAVEFSVGMPHGFKPLP